MAVIAKNEKAFFSKVKIARDLLRERSEEILKQYLLIVDEARAAGDYETAAKAMIWLMEHMPADAEDGARIVDVSVDKKVQEVKTGPVGPAIQIGIAVGGLGEKSLKNPKKPKELPQVEVIEVEPSE